MLLKYKIVKAMGALSSPCKDINNINEGFEIIDKLEKALENENGIGLAANQIGIKKRVCILRVPDSETDETYGVNLINPVITSLKKPIKFPNEGCLSFPGIKTETLRYLEVTVSDLLEPEGRTFHGLMAICAQHEIDHTNGKTMYHSLFKNFKDETNCPCQSGEKYKNCCKNKIIDLNKGK